MNQPGSTRSLFWKLKLADGSGNALGAIGLPGIRRASHGKDRLKIQPSITC